ncbi:MAG: hypothetical protein WCQ00_03200 [bacterium]
MIYKKINTNFKQGFTLIEIVIYCAVFVTFAVFVIESMIQMNSRLASNDKRTEFRNDNIYNINFANIYRRFRISNQKIENSFSSLVSNTVQSTPELKEDRDIGIKFNKTSSSVILKEKYDLVFFDSIE